MKQSYWLKKSWVSVGTTILLCVGCGHINKLSIEQLAREVVQESYTAKMVGYKQVVTVDAPLEDVFDYLSNPDNIPIHSPKPEEGKGLPSAVEKSVELGSSFANNIEKMGFKIPGRVILVKNDMENTWFIWDNPNIFQVRKWQFTSVNEGTRIKIIFESEISQERMWTPLQRMVESMTNKIYREFDVLMARMQAHFDPSLDADELVAVGLRGESYELIYQAHEARVWINAPMKDVAAWLNNPDNRYLQLIGKDNSCPYQPIPAGEILYCPSSYEFRTRGEPIDTFLVETRKDRKYKRRIYMVSKSQVGYLDMRLKPGAGGTILKIRVMFEIPDATSTQSLDYLLFMASMPDKMKESALQIKEGIEKEN